MSSPAQSSRPRAQRTALAIVASLFTLAGFLGIGALLIWGLDAAEEPYRKVELDLVRQLDRKLTLLGRYDGPPRLAYLGDSLSMPTNGKPAPAELAQILRKRAGAPPGSSTLINFSSAGLTSFSHYFISERLAGLGVDRFIIATNLGWFSRKRFAQQPALAGMLPANRWPEAATLPLHEIGLSADEVVLSNAWLQTGLFNIPWQIQREQVRFRNAVDRAGHRLQHAVGHARGARYQRRVTQYRTHRIYDGKRPTYIGAVDRWGAVLEGLAPDDPNLLVLDALVRRLRATGARVLVMVPPTNVEIMTKLDLAPGDGFQTSLDRIRDVATQHGADFLDLHDLLPDSAFRDPTDHLNFRARPLPARLIAQQLILWSEGADEWDRRRPTRAPLARTTSN